MSKFWIGEPLSEEITEICWQDEDCDMQWLENGIHTVTFPSEVYKKDVPKLIKALQKAKELGWWKEEEDKV
jgi:hypothetical protein